MLPWKRSKFELIEEDQRAKQKGYSASLSYSALSSLARSCPESALWRVGSVFRSRRKKVQITGEDPTYTRLKRREDARHQQQQLVGEGTVPVAPLRKLLLLNGQCCYKPPVERSRSAPKLGSITEDLLGEEQEERAAHFEYEDLLGGGGVPEDAGQGLDRLIGDLAEMSIGNDVRALRADLGVTRLLSGESTSSESSADGPQEAPSTPEDGPVQEMG
ncbi:protein FAM43A-like [Scleropages formosus]|uniref:Protein FAM43A-like n=1 Tax=Scleropages formosus TaxID=113540 RepID=A0A0N8K231_SCLFO|nr:protein FAM43A-like [Scleropages formosus]